MVAAPGGHASAAAAHRPSVQPQTRHHDRAHRRRLDASDSEISKTLAQLRPWSLMVVIANSDDYVSDMMTALRV